MARSVTKKKSVDPSHSGNLLSFFRKSDQPSPTTARRTSGKSEQDDIKPDLARSRSAKGKSKAVEEHGSAVDPVVISDDEDIQASTVTTTLKRQPSHSSRHSIPIDISNSEVESPPAGPSRSPQRSCSPPPPPTTDPFPHLNGFQPPSTWPTIVNIGHEEALLHDESDGDGSVRGGSDDVDDDDPIEVHDRMADGAADDTIDSEEPEIDPQVPPRIMRFRPVAKESAIGQPLDLGMEWDEPEDEGMGMEEEDEDSTEIRTPPPAIVKRKKTEGGKVNECPVCGKSLNGRANTVVQNHINSCLDGSSSTPQKASHPITSINHSFSPAPPTPSPPPEETKGPNAFSVLMSGHKEKEQWKDAEVDLNRNGKRVFGRRKAPFYKVLTGMPVAVDAFRYGAIPKVTAYLLSHAHSDHYTNLSKSWKEGPIYCSQTTANLIIHMLGVEPQWVHGLPNDIPFVMPNTGGVTVTPIEANHCPGSSLFLFEGPQTVNAGDSTIRSPYVGSKRTFRFLHCGDFRANPRMVLHPMIARAKIDTCYLDTTYLNPKYCFPPQPQVIEACAKLARKTALGISEHAPSLDDLKPDVKVDTRFDTKPDINAIIEENEEKTRALMSGWLVKKEEDSKEGIFGEVKTETGVDEKGEIVERLADVKPKVKARTLIVMGTYSIGKERIVKAVAKALGTKIYCDPRKKGILLCQTDPDLHLLMSSDPLECQVHLLPLSNIQLDRLQEYLTRLHPHFDRVLGFRPTGWAYSPPAGTDMLPDVNMVIKRDQSRTFTDSSLKPMRGSCRQFMMYGVPYSEHSSFFELTCFALSLPGPDLRMIATVNVGNEKSRAKMKKWFEKWQAEKSKRREKNLPVIVDYRDETYW